LSNIRNSMERILVFSDPHQQWRKVKALLKNWKGRVICGGDWWDSHRNNVDADVASTAWFIKDFIQDPNHISLIGNHDLSYILPHKGLVYCSGYSEYKHDKINSILSTDDWARFKFFHAEENFWFSHAGINAHWFSDPILGVTEESINKTLEVSWERLQGGILEGSGAIHAAGKARSGRYEVGGILWADITEAEHHPYVTQICGHSYGRRIRTTYGEHNAKNVFIDTDMGRCVIIEEDCSITEVNLWINPSPC
jgi:hypothetical protein